MKKSLLALAVLGAFAGAAAAQSSVTLFGGLDLNARSIKNADVSQKQLATDGIYSSRIGIKGVEDLGGGLKAGFHIEGATTPDDGTAAGQTWKRRSTASLMGGFGELRLGRDYTPQFWNYTVFDPFGTNGVASSNNVNTVLASGAGTQVRADNTIGYFLPGGLGGLYGQFQISAAEAAAPNGNKNSGLRLGFATGPVDVAFAYGKTDVTGGNLKTTSLGASFLVGPVKLMGQYNQVKASATSLKQVNMLIGATVKVGAAGTVKASYDKANASGGTTDANDATLVGLGYEQALSARTSLYANYGSISNKGAQTFTVATIKSPASTIAMGGKKSTGYEFGVKHTF
jgi:predicted porin